MARLAMFIFMAWSTQAETLVCDGILGNSGEQGMTLIRFGKADPKGAVTGGAPAGMGVAVDRFGSIWDRGGEGVLNRYAPDGRLLGSYTIAGGNGRGDQLTLAGDTLVILVDNKVFTLDVNAESGSAAKPLIKEAQCLSFGSSGTKIAAFYKGEVSELDVANGESKPLFKVKDCHMLEVVPAGKAWIVYVGTNGMIQKFVDGKEVTEGWPKKSPGERFQFVDGAFYGHAWHGTIRKFSADLEPDPGVILGGSRSTINGHLDQNSDLSNGRGMAKVGADLFAVSGHGGVLHLMRWDGSRRQMELVRRIGALSHCNALGLDKNGTVWCHHGTWAWSDKPDAPLLNGVNALERLGQAVMLDGERVVAPGLMWGKPSFVFGDIVKEVKTERVEKECALKLHFAGSAVLKTAKGLLLIAIDEKGNGQSFRIGADGKYNADAGAVVLKTEPPVKEWTSLAMKDETTLLAGGDGAVIELTQAGEGEWKEIRRWSRWDGDKFGARVVICSDAGRLWVSDSARERVLVFDAAGKPLASFGTTDKKGRSLSTLDVPQRIMASGNRAVVFDSGNQRLVKLNLK